jgi:ketosteroid isomerase-like protein
MNPSAAASYLDAANRIFENEVIAKGDFAALDNVYTRQARILPPGTEMISGRENIRSFWQRAVSQLGIKSVRLRTVDLETLGDTAIEIGRAELGTAGPAIEVKYVVVWKREDGAWKWHVDIWNPVG